MACRRYAVIILLSLLVNASLVGTIGAEGTTEQLGIVRSYNPGDMEAKASDVVADSEDGLALLTRGDDGVIVWDLETGKASQVLIPSRARTVSVELAWVWPMVTDVTGRLHGVNVELGRISWSKSVFPGTLRVTSVNDAESRMAFLGINDDFRMIISVISFPDTEVITGWSNGIPEDMAYTTPSSAVWLPPGAVQDWLSHTLLIGTTEGQIYAWRGSGLYDTIIDLDEEIVGMAWDDSIAKLVVATRKGRIYFVSVHNREVTSTFITEFTSPRTLESFDYLNGRMAAGGSDGQIEVWNMTTLHRTQIIRHHNFSLADVAWADEDRLVSAGRFSMLVQWAPDTDGDLHADVVDAFPTDRTEWRDSDDDGVGDVRDMFPDDPKESLDTDGDGVGDNADVFPKDPTEWVDSDGDGVGDNGDFIPKMNNMLAAGLFMSVVAVAAMVPVARMVHVNRRGRRKRREAVMTWLEELDVTPAPELASPNGRDRLDRARVAYSVQEAANPLRLTQTVEAYDTTVLNTMVALRVQDEITQRGGVGADAAIARAVRLRDQLQELDTERERLDSICRSYWKVQDGVEATMKAAWPVMKGLDKVMADYEERIQMLDNTLEQFRKSSVIKIGDEAAKVSRGAYVVAAKEVRLRGAERPLGVKVDVPPRPEILQPEPDEVGEGTPLSVTPPVGHLRTRLAMLVRDDTSDLVVTVDNTLAEDLEDLTISFTIAGDRLRHKGPHKVELGKVVTGRTRGATFQMRVVPPPPSDEEPAELTRLLARVTGKVGTRRVRQELPAKATNLVMSTLERPSSYDLTDIRRYTVGRRGVRFPRVPSHTVLNALEFPHGMLPLMDGSLVGGGTWRIFVSMTDAEEPVMVLVGVETGPEWVDLMVEVRGPPRFLSRELAEELIDSVRYSILTDKRLRLRGEDRPLPPERMKELADLIAKAYIGHPDADLLAKGKKEGKA